MRDQLIVASIDFQHAPLAIRDRLSLSGETLQARLRAIPATFNERLILSTCNRFEIYARTDANDSASSLLAWLAAAQGVPLATLRKSTMVQCQTDALDHLFRVAAGLESMVLGEPQILTQIRDALDASRAAGTAGPLLNRLALTALHLGKRARTETGIARNRCSLAHVAVDRAAAELHGLRRRRAAVIGAGATGSLAARILRAADLADFVVLNRSVDRGQALATAVGARFAPLANLPNELAATDVVIAAATVSQPLITAATIAPNPARTRPLLAIDLGVPRNIDPAAATRNGVRIIDLDTLEPHAVARQHDYSAEIAAVESLVATAVEEFMTWWQSRPATVTIAAMRQHADAIRTAELDAALRKLGHLSERDRNVVAALSVGLVNKLLHQPTTALRQSDQPEVMARMAGELFGLNPTTHSAES